MSDIFTSLDRSSAYLRPEEKVRVLEACGHVRTHSLRPIVVLALHTGMRRGELPSLKWSHVDLVRRTVRVVNAKTRSGDRVISINVNVYATLSAIPRTDASKFVFSSNRNVGERFLDLKKGFEKAVRLANIIDIRFHDLRHTFATRLVQAGVDLIIDLITVQHLLGHAKITMTSRYADSPTDARIAAVRRLETPECLQPDPNRTPEANGTPLGLMFKTPVLNSLGP